MYSRPIVKDDFEVPKELVTKNFILSPLTVKHLKSDYEAVMKSENHLYKLMDDSDWPKMMTINENLAYLGWHEVEYSLRHSFAYTVLSPKNREEVIGCCYIYPSDNPDFEVQAYYWIRQDLLSSGLEIELGNTFKIWLEKTWPFKKIEFPRRDI